MPYYGARGDYYRGDYYRGDPFLGAIVGRVGGAVLGRAGAAIGRAVARIGGSRVGRAVVEQAPGVGAGIALTQLAQRVGPQLPALPGMGPSQGGQIELPGFGTKKKYRKMNPLNPRALRRALRRAEGFEKFARKTVSGLRYGPKKFKSQKRKG